MKAPNKINVPILNGKLFGIIKEDGGRFRDCDGHIEYLRKDALLEWIHKEVDKLEFKRGDKSADGARQAFYWLTDKLNSM